MTREELYRKYEMYHYEIGDIKDPSTIKATPLYNIVLPEEYQQVEYIGSTGKQYCRVASVDTTKDFTISATVSFQSHSATWEPIYVHSVVGGIWIGCHENRLVFRVYSTADRIIAAPPSLNKVTNIIVDKKGNVVNLYVDYVNVGTTTVDKLVYNSEYDDVFWTDTVVCSGMRLYSLTTPKTKLVPCYRKSDSVAGLYDRKNSVFYTNLGSGSFVIGPNIG